MTKSILFCASFLLELLTGSVFIVLLWNRLIEYRISIKKPWPFLLSLLVIITSVASCLIISDMESLSFTGDILLSLAMLVLPHTLFKPIKKSSMFLLDFAVLVTADFLVYIISVCAGINNEILICLIYSALFLFGIAAVLILTSKQNKFRLGDVFENMPLIIYITVFIADFSAYYGVSLTVDNDGYGDVYQFLVILSVVSVIACISFIIYKFTVISKQEMEKKAQLETQLDYYKKKLDNAQDTRKFRHDIKNNLYALNVLINDGKSEEAIEYLNSLGGALSSAEPAFSTGNQLADAILSDKSEKASANDTSISFEGIIPDYGVSNYDLCTVMTNALDNAIEACKELKNSCICVTSVLKDNCLTLSFVNPVSKKVLIKNGRVKTTKSDRQNHGFGIDNIRSAIKKYDGLFDISCNDNQFTLDVTVFIDK